MPQMKNPTRVVAIAEPGPIQEQIRSALDSDSEFQLLDVLQSLERVIPEIRAAQPNMIVLDHQVGEESTLDTIDAVALQFPEIAIVAILPSDDLVRAQQALLAGVRTFLVQPFTQDHMLATLRRVRDLETRRAQFHAEEAARAAEGSEPVRILTVFSPRGGVGCSTLAANLALALRDQTAERVLLMDGKLLFGHIGLMLNVRTPNSIADLIPHAQFYFTEGLDALLDCLRQAVSARGLPLRLYVDNAKVYRSGQLASIAASLGILVVHTPPYQPQGRGKIERWFRTVRDQFLANLDRQHPLTLEELNSRLWRWIDRHYHRCPHSALGSTPLLRWQRDIEKIRQIPPATDVRRLFFHRVLRLVRRDSTFRLHSQLYEAPAHLAGQRPEIRFDPLDLSQVELYLDGKLQGQARPVDPVVNASLPRAQPEASEPSDPTGINYLELLQDDSQDEED